MNGIYIYGSRYEKVLELVEFTFIEGEVREGGLGHKAIINHTVRWKFRRVKRKEIEHV